MSKNDYRYNGVVVFQTPIQIRNDHDEVISIYGLLYNWEQKHKDDLWTWELNRYICYLQGCERAQENGCRLAPGLLITATDNMIPLNYRIKSQIYRIMKEDMIDYRLVEPVETFEINEDQVDDTCIISQKLIDRIQKNDKKI